MEKSFSLKDELKRLKATPEFNGDSVWIVTDSSHIDPGKLYVFEENKKDLVIAKARECGWEYISDTSVHNHLDRTSVFSQGQIKISIVRTKVIGRGSNESVYSSFAS